MSAITKYLIIIVLISVLILVLLGVAGKIHFSVLQEMSLVKGLFNA